MRRNDRPRAGDPRRRQQEPADDVTRVVRYRDHVGHAHRARREPTGERDLRACTPGGGQDDHREDDRHARRRVAAGIEAPSQVACALAGQEVGLAEDGLEQGSGCLGPDQGDGQRGGRAAPAAHDREAQDRGDGDGDRDRVHNVHERASETVERAALQRVVEDVLVEAAPRARAGGKRVERGERHRRHQRKRPRRDATASLMRRPATRGACADRPDPHVPRAATRAVERGGPPDAAAAVQRRGWHLRARPHRRSPGKRGSVPAAAVSSRSDGRAQPLA